LSAAQVVVTQILVEEISSASKFFAGEFSIAVQDQQLDTQEIFGVACILLTDELKGFIGKTWMFPAKGFNEFEFLIGGGFATATCSPKGRGKFDKIPDATIYVLENEIQEKIS
jgi:hypothetical protein